MQLLLAIFASLMFCGVAHCQTVISAEEEVARIIQADGYEGHDEKIVGRMGDAAAVAVTKVMAASSIGPREIRRILLILRMSLAAPKIVGAEPDRQPRTTLFVLRYLDSLTGDPELKKAISETREFVQQQFETYKKEESQKKK